MKRTAKRAISMLVLTAQAACMTGPRLVRTTPADYLEMKSPPRVWAKLNDGSQIVIEGPRVIQDTVFGWAEGEEFVAPTSDFQELRVQEVSVVRSSIIPVLLTAGLVGTIFLVKHSTGSSANPDITQTNDCKLDPQNHPECVAGATAPLVGGAP